MDQTSETEKVYQRQKYEEIIEILLTAGYFRARITDLSEFDKVVGGMCWSITSSGEDVDVDILFQENSTIGQRIALAEAICSALQKMKCPVTIQPHQIQGGVGGSDYPALYPAIVWLVKKSFEHREEREAQLRAFSTLQFTKNFQFPNESNSYTVTPDLGKILDRNRAKRIFKRKDVKGGTEETRVRACLLEYGESFSTPGEGTDGKSGSSGSGAGESKNGGHGGAGVTVSVGKDSGKKIIRTEDIALSKLGLAAGSGNKADMSQFEKKLAKAALEAEKEEKQFAEEAIRMEKELMQDMKHIGDSDEATGQGGISGSSVGQIVGLGSVEIGSAVAAYKLEVEEARKALDENISGGKSTQIASLKRQQAHLEKQKEVIVARAGGVKETIVSISDHLAILEDERDGAVEYNQKLAEQLKKLTALEADASQKDELNNLKHLVSLNETLKSQEAGFKESCKLQMTQLKSQIAEVEGSKDNQAMTPEEKKLQDIEDMHAKVMAKYNRLRGLLAQTNLDLARNTRIIDDVPTRTELIQYERRFVELYSQVFESLQQLSSITLYLTLRTSYGIQVAWKLDETKKYYSMYNTLDTTLSFLQKEVKLLNSIGGSFEEAMQNSQSTREYLQQAESIIKGLEDSLRRQETIAAQREEGVEELKTKHQNVRLSYIFVYTCIFGGMLTLRVLQLVDEQRKYFKAIKDFQDECTKNEWLSGKLEQMSHQQQVTSQGIFINANNICKVVLLM